MDEPMTRFEQRLESALRGYADQPGKAWEPAEVVADVTRRRRGEGRRWVFRGARPLAATVAALLVVAVVGVGIIGPRIGGQASYPAMVRVNGLDYYVGGGRGLTVTQGDITRYAVLETGRFSMPLDQFADRIAYSLQGVDPLEALVARANPGYRDGSSTSGEFVVLWGPAGPIGSGHQTYSAAMCSHFDLSHPAYREIKCRPATPGPTTGATDVPSPSVWLPGDGLHVPAAVQDRAPLPFCGLAQGEQEVNDATGCALAALQRGQPAEFVSEFGEPEGSLLIIVRVFPEGRSEVIWRSLAAGLPPLWEIEHCGEVADGIDDERDGMRISTLLLRDCGGLVPLGTDPSLVAVPTQAPEPQPVGTPGACPSALIEGRLVPDERWGMALEDTDGLIRKVIWPHGYAARREGSQLALLDASGSVVAYEGDFVGIGGGETGGGGDWLACGGITVVTTASRPDPGAEPTPRSTEEPSAALPPDSSYAFGPYPGRPWYGPDGQRVASTVLSSFRTSACGWTQVVLLQLGWPLGSDHRDTTVRQYVRDPGAEMPSRWNLLDSYEADVQLPNTARRTGYSTEGIQLWLDPATSERHVYAGFADRVERWPRADPIVACG